MAAAYTILGKAVPAHQLALATLGLVVFATIPKPWGPPAPAHPPISSSSAEEEKFIKEYLAKNLKEGH
jgi:F-type H+-transporting ATPase subunit k